MQYKNLKTLGLSNTAGTLYNEAEAKLQIKISPEHLKYLPLEPSTLSSLAREEWPLVTLVDLGLRHLSQGQQLPPNLTLGQQIRTAILFMQLEHLNAMGLGSTSAILRVEAERTLNAQLSPDTLTSLPIMPEVRANLSNEPHPLLTLVALGMRHLTIPPSPAEAVASLEEDLEAPALPLPPPTPPQEPPQPPPAEEDTEKPKSKVVHPTTGFIMKKKKPYEDWTWKERIVAFYSEKAPEKVADVDKLLRRYANHEEELLAIMLVKYGESEYERSHHIDDDVMDRLHAEKKAHEDRQAVVAEARQREAQAAAAAAAAALPAPPETPSSAGTAPDSKNMFSSAPVEEVKNSEPARPPPSGPAHPSSAHVDSILQNLDSVSLDTLISSATKPKREKDTNAGTTGAASVEKAAGGTSAATAANALAGRQRRRGGNIQGISRGKRQSSMNFLDANQLAMITAAAAASGQAKSGKHQDAAHFQSVKHLMFVHEPRSSIVHKKILSVQVPVAKSFPEASEDGDDDGKITQVQVQEDSPTEEPVVSRADVYREVSRPNREVLLIMPDRVQIQDNSVIGAQPLMLRDVTDVGVPTRIRSSSELLSRNEFLRDESVIAINPSALLRALITVLKYKRMGEEAFEESSEEEEEEWVKFKFKTKGEIERARMEAQKEQRRIRNTDDEPWRELIETHDESCQELFQLFHCMPMKFATDMPEFFMRLTIFLDTHEEDVEDVIDLLHNWFDVMNERFSWYSRSVLKIILGEARKLISTLGSRVMLRQQIDSVVGRIDELEARAKIDSSGAVNRVKGAVHSVIALNRMKGIRVSEVPAAESTPVAKPRQLKATDIWSVSATKGTWDKTEADDGGEEKAQVPAESAVFGANSNAARANVGLPPKPRVVAGLDLLSDEHNDLFNASIFDPREVARQMTLTAHGLFKQIPIYELDYDEAPRRKHLKDAYYQYLDYHEAVYNFVTYSVLQPNTPADRAERIHFFVEMMAECLDLRNAHCASQIISALNRKYPKELKETMSKVDAKYPNDRKQIEDMTKLFVIQQSNREYRQRLDGWVTGLGTGETKYAGHGDGIIPDLQVHLRVRASAKITSKERTAAFVPALLFVLFNKCALSLAIFRCQDLNYGQTGNRDMHPLFPELINVEKIRLRYSILDFIFGLQQRSYNLEPVRFVNTALNRRMMNRRVNFWARPQTEEYNQLYQVIRLLGERAFFGTNASRGESDFVVPETAGGEAMGGAGPAAGGSQRQPTPGKRPDGNRNRRTTNIALGGGGLPGLPPGGLG